MSLSILQDLYSVRFDFKYKKTFLLRIFTPKDFVSENIFFKPNVSANLVRGTVAAHLLIRRMLDKMR